MPSHHTVSAWIEGLKAGDAAAAEELSQRYFGLLVALARRRLQGARVRAADGEDAALSAFDSFCRGAEQGRFPRLNDRDDLWQLLVMITTRKAFDLVKHEGRDRRDWRRLQGQPDADPDDSGSLMRELIGREPEPGYAAQVAEELEQLLGRLPGDELRQVALRKLEGHTNEEIGGQLDLALATMERRMRLIRKYWESQAPC